MAEERELPEYLRFVQLLWELDHALNKRSRWMLKHLGITAEQRFMVATTPEPATLVFLGSGLLLIALSQIRRRRKSRHAARRSTVPAVGKD